MTGAERIESALRRHPNAETSASFARRVMNEIRTDAPEPLRFPWLRMMVTIVLGVSAVALAFPLAPGDPVAPGALLVCGASVAAVVRLIGPA